MNIFEIIFIASLSITVFGLFIYYLINIYCSHLLYQQPTNEPNIFSVIMIRPVPTNADTYNPIDVETNIEVIDLQST